MDIKELSKLLQESGVVGAGGAGFPTYVKIDERADTIILNCAECEPLLKLHKHLVEQCAYEILSAFSMIAEIVKAGKAIIGIKRDSNIAIDAIKQYINQFPKVSVHLLETVYPMGDEIVLIYETTGKVIKPGQLPIDAGVAVFNAETVYNIYCAVEKEQPVTDKLVTVAGEVLNPVTVRVPLGCTIEDTVKLAEEITTPSPIYFVGGPMMGAVQSPFATVTKTTNGILVLPKEHLLVRTKQSNCSIDLKRAASACCQCQACSDLCPRGALGHPVTPHKFMRAASNKDFADTNTFTDTLFCSSCGVCEMYACPQSLSPRTLMAEYKNGLRRAGVKVPTGIKPATVKSSRQWRKVPEERLAARLGVTKYEADAPLDNSVVAMNRVKIAMSQHIGAPSVPVVTAGDFVEKGQIIATAGNGLSVAVHATIDGIVTSVCNDYIIIEKESERAKSV